ncbi:IclR family transcriptional regulator [Bengtsoniella intestinalis]|uniref:IclR family transcriptional regulator n=1 Tax=Bengtsoniella intestinalis TaxID=3073143 RepID=UPI00391F2777
MEQSKSPDGVQSVERAFLLLETVAKNGVMSLNALHKAVGLNKPSTLRLANTLSSIGYLDKNADGAYSLSLKTYELGSSALRRIDRMELITATLQELCEKTGRVAQFSIEDHNELLCIRSTHTNSQSFSVYTTVGRRAPLYCTSAGKAILSTYSNQQIIDKWEQIDIKAFTKFTHTTGQNLLQDISEIRQQGYALDVEENEYNVICIGAIVRDHNGGIVGAISISGNNVTREDMEAYKDVLMSATSRLSSLFGYL